MLIYILYRSTLYLQKLISNFAKHGSKIGLGIEFRDRIPNLAFLPPSSECIHFYLPSRFLLPVKYFARSPVTVSLFPSHVFIGRPLG